MTATVTFVRLLMPVICTIYETQALIGELNTFFNIDHNLILAGSSTDLNRFLSTRRKGAVDTPQTLHIFNNVTGNVTGLKNLNRTRSKNELLIVVAYSSNFETDLNLMKKVKQIQRFRLSIKIGLFFSDHVASDDLRRLFEWSWKNRIINIFAATYSDVPTEPDTEKMINIFTYSPFGTFRVINVTSSSFDEFFLSQKSNFQQYPLEVGHKDEDYPRSTKVWQSVFHVMNCSYKFTDKSIPKAELVRNYSIDLLSRLYTKSGLNADYIYPVEMPVFTIISPEALPYSEFLAYLQNLISDKVFGYTSITIIAILLLLSMARYKKEKKIVFFATVADVVNLLMNDNCDIRYQRLSRIESCVIVPLTFVGLVIVNGILSHFQSHLTQPFLQPQINTVEDMYRSSYPILTANMELQTNFIDSLEHRTKNMNWSEKIILMEKAMFDEERRMFNLSAMYITQEDISLRLLRVQKKLQIRGYHIAQKGIGRTLICYSINEEFQFLERLNEIFHWMRSAGLYDYWLAQDDIVREKWILQKNIKRLEHEMRNKSGNDEVDKFPLPDFLLYGWIAGTILFVVEVMWFKLLVRFALKIKKMRSFYK